ncbi:MAG: clostripain-related cysteine peptidase [Bacteroidales bacterium]|nr:clostripain-related cysteine peptidase [Bacteroidales bacterium]MDD4670514.1 clostripain-related cysteine peptidase [Bacteroidales bacterium]
MKRYGVIIIALLALIASQFAVSCNCIEREEERRSVLLYIAANNSLASYAENCIEDLAKGYLPAYNSKSEVLMVLYHTVNSAPKLSRYYRSTKGECTEEIIHTYDISSNSADISFFTQVINDVETAYPSKQHGLILWSHSTGWLPEGYYSNPQEYNDWNLSPRSTVIDPYADIVKSIHGKSFGEDSGKEIEISMLSEALQQRYEFILFDCCLMGGIEVAYEFKDKCDYVLFSPTEILAQSFPYDTMMDIVFNAKDREAGLIRICKDYFDYYQSQTGTYQSATVSIVRTSELDYLSSICKSIFGNNRAKMEKVNPSDIQGYFRFNKHWFYDFDDYISRIASADEYASFTEALSRAVIYKAATERFLNITIKKYSGLSTYIPNPEYVYLNNFYKTLRWNIATEMVK